MSTWLLTWNPDRWDWGSLQDDVEAVQRYGRHASRWSCGNARQIAVGERFFLLRQGKDRAGLVGSGFITSKPYSGTHWAGGGTAWYVDVEFDCIVTSPAIQRAELVRGPDALRTKVWATQASGVRIPAQVGVALEERWAEVTGLRRPATVGDAAGPARRAEPSFRRPEVLPLIARLITRSPPDATGFVDHDAIVTAMLGDAEAVEIVVRARAAAAWSDDRAAASNMVAWFSQTITVGRSRWAEFFDREQRDGGWAYRPKTAVVSPIGADLELAAIEGDPRLFFHIRRERDRALAEAKRAAMRRPDGQLMCEVCGFSVPHAYPGLSGDVCEVHHRRPLAEAADAVTTRLEDLALLCPNCHRAIHRTAPLLSVEDFRTRFFPSLSVAIPREPT